jgi:hypothetical protein
MYFRAMRNRVRKMRQAPARRPLFAPAVAAEARPDRCLLDVPVLLALGGEVPVYHLGSRALE